MTVLYYKLYLCSVYMRLYYLCGPLLLKVKVIQIQHRRENPRCTCQRAYRRQPIRIARFVVCAEDLRTGNPGAVGGHYNHPSCHQCLSGMEG